MKKKCDICHGKGGWTKNTGLLKKLFISCQQCQGKGVWWTNKRPTLNYKGRTK